LADTIVLVISMGYTITHPAIMDKKIAKQLIFNFINLSCFLVFLYLQDIFCFPFFFCQPSMFMALDIHFGLSWFKCWLFWLGFCTWALWESLCTQRTRARQGTGTHLYYFCLVFKIEASLFNSTGSCFWSYVNRPVFGITSISGNNAC